MQLTPLNAVSPVDGRYFDAVKPLSPYFSEYGLIRYRILIEIEYLISLARHLPELAQFPSNGAENLRSIYRDFTEQDAARIKDIEKQTNHDVKAVEYFIKEKLETFKLGFLKEFIHFGLTSQDVNNTAVPLSIKEYVEREYLPALEKLTNLLHTLANEWQDVAMLARTHGQPASPTRLGKEVRVFASRLEAQRSLMMTIPYSAKFGGATGNFNAHHVAYPEIDWHAFADEFCKGLGLSRSVPTTQIEHYDNLAALFDNLKRINTVLIDFCRDIWHYISIEYFKQKIVAGEIGSSAMPHKVNPIDFENAEGNLGLANAIFEHLAAKLPISRLQRDLTDSTVLRNIGVPIAHTHISFLSIIRGLSRIQLNKPALDRDLNENWAVVGEAIQTILRKSGYPNPYEALKELTRRSEKVTQKSIAEFIDSLDVDEKVRKKLKSITPSNYTGI